ncbi:hypothetical protein MRB53_038271 [Persea americana]|nr:hypothetical protein MRB53_038271 [Persea americana]
MEQIQDSVLGPDLIWRIYTRDGFPTDHRRNAARRRHLQDDDFHYQAGYIIEKPWPNAAPVPLKEPPKVRKSMGETWDDEVRRVDYGRIISVHEMRQQLQSLMTPIIEHEKAELWDKFRSIEVIRKYRKGADEVINLLSWREFDLTMSASIIFPPRYREKKLLYNSDPNDIPDQHKYGRNEQIALYMEAKLRRFMRRKFVSSHIQVLKKKLIPSIKTAVGKIEERLNQDALKNGRPRWPLLQDIACTETRKHRFMTAIRPALEQITREEEFAHLDAVFYGCNRPPGLDFALTATVLRRFHMKEELKGEGLFKSYFAPKRTKNNKKNKKNKQLEHEDIVDDEEEEEDDENDGLGCADNETAPGRKRMQRQGLSQTVHRSRKGGALNLIRWPYVELTRHQMSFVEDAETPTNRRTLTDTTAAPHVNLLGGTVSFDHVQELFVETSLNLLTHDMRDPESLEASAVCRTSARLPDSHDYFCRLEFYHARTAIEKSREVRRLKLGKTSSGHQFYLPLGRTVWQQQVLELAKLVKPCIEQHNGECSLNGQECLALDNAREGLGGLTSLHQIIAVPKRHSSRLATRTPDDLFSRDINSMGVGNRLVLQIRWAYCLAEAAGPGTSTLRTRLRQELPECSGGERLKVTPQSCWSETRQSGAFHSQGHALRRGLRSAIEPLQYDIHHPHMPLGGIVNVAAPVNPLARHVMAYQLPILPSQPHILESHYADSVSASSNHYSPEGLDENGMPLTFETTKFGNRSLECAAPATTTMTGQVYTALEHGHYGNELIFPGTSTESLPVVPTYSFHDKGPYEFQPVMSHLDRVYGEHLEMTRQSSISQMDDSQSNSRMHSLAVASRSLAGSFEDSQESDDYPKHNFPILGSNDPEREAERRNLFAADSQHSLDALASSSDNPTTPATDAIWVSHEDAEQNYYAPALDDDPTIRSFACDFQNELAQSQPGEGWLDVDMDGLQCAEAEAVAESQEETEALPAPVPMRMCAVPKLLPSALEDD